MNTSTCCLHKCKHRNLSNVLSRLVQSYAWLSLNRWKSSCMYSWTVVIFPQGSPHIRERRLGRTSSCFATGRRRQTVLTGLCFRTASLTGRIPWRHPGGLADRAFGVKHAASIPHMSPNAHGDETLSFHIALWVFHPQDGKGNREVFLIIWRRVLVEELGFWFRRVKGFTNYPRVLSDCGVDMTVIVKSLTIV